MIEPIALGNSGLVVPRLFLGTGSYTFDYGSAQAKIPPEQYALILKKAYALGIRFWDTSDDYKTHPHVRAGMQGLPREKLIIATKTYADTRAAALKSLATSLHELNTPYADIFHLHSVDSLPGYEKRMQEALLGLQEAKRAGKIKAVGLSTHNIHVLEKAVEHPDLDIVMTNYNKFEIHMDASLERYTQSLKRAFELGKGVLVMKTIGEGRLHEHVAETIRYNLGRPFIHSVCVGIVSEKELHEAVACAIPVSAAQRDSKT